MTSDSPASEIAVEVCYAEPGRQLLLDLNVPASATVEEAIRRSGILEQVPHIDLAGANKVGVFGRLCDLQDALRAGDRIEIYRPLRVAPQDSRRRRAAAGRRL